MLNAQPEAGPRAPRRAVGAAWPALLAAAALGLWLLAYQAPLSLSLAVGGDPELRRREDDAPFLTGVLGSEPADFVPDPDDPDAELLWYDYLARSGGRPYRWTSDAAELAVPGAGGGPWQLELLAGGGRPDGAPTLSRWQLGDSSAVDLELPAGEPRRYRLLVPADLAGDLRVAMATSTFTTTVDPRPLGFVLYGARVSPLGGAPRAPAWPQIGWLALALGGVALATWLLRAGRAAALALGLGAALAAGAALALARPALTLFTPTLAALALGGVLLAAGARAAARPLSRRDPVAAGFALQVAGLCALALALRLAGMWHPHALYSDSGLHANKLYALALGQVFQSAGLPAESGGGQAPYPTGPYLLIAPGLLLLPPGRELRVPLMQLGAALLDSLTIPLIAFSARRAGLGRPAALLGAALYLLPITALESFAVGELANIAGQAMAMPFIALLALGALARPEPPSRVAGAALHAAPYAPLAALCAGLLAHSGVTLSLGAFVAAAWGLALVAALRGRATPLEPRRLALVAALALALAGIFYYSAPPYLETLLDRVVGGGPATRADAAAEGAGEAGEAVRRAVPPLDILRETALAPLGLVAPRSRAWSLPLALCLPALGGLWLLWRRGEAQAAGLRLALAAWWLGMLLTQGLLLVAEQGVRWSMFLYPALCLSAGALLGALWARGRAGRATALILLAWAIGYGLLMWASQIRDYYHV